MAEWNRLGNWHAWTAVLVTIWGFLLYAVTFRRRGGSEMWLGVAWRAVESFLSRPRAGIELEAFISLIELWIGLYHLFAPSDRVTLAFQTSSDLVVEFPPLWLLTGLLTAAGIAIYAAAKSREALGRDTEAVRLGSMSSHMRFAAGIVSVFVWFSVTAAEWASPFTTDLVRGLSVLCLVAQCRVALGARLHSWSTRQV